MNFTYGQPILKEYIECKNSSYTCGNYCSIGLNVTIFLGGNHRTDWVSTYPFGYVYEHVFTTKIPGECTTRGDVIIGNDVWIADNVTIMSPV